MVTPALICLALLAQPDGAALRGQTIEAVEIVAAPEEDPDALRSFSDLRPGVPYRASLIRRAVERFVQLERFENVIARVRPAPRGGLIVLFELPPKLRLRQIRFVGAEGLDRARMRTALGVVPGDPIRADQLSSLRKRLEQALERSGWRNPALGLSFETVSENGDVDLVAELKLGLRTRVRSIQFSGDPRRPSWDLRRWVTLDAGDVLDLDRLQRELDELDRDYRGRGHYDVVIDVPEVREVFSAAGDASLADVIVPIRAGPEVTVRVLGNRRVSRRVFKPEFALLQERGTDAIVLREVRDRVLDALRLRGHWKAEVRVGAATSPDEARRTVRFEVDEGPVGRIVRLRFPGRSALARDVLVDEVHSVLTRTLASLTEQPGADPEVVTAIVGGVPARGPTRRRQPDGTPPDPKAIFIQRAHRNAGDALASVYRSQGYQQVDVRRPEVLERPDGLLEVSYAIQEGIQWRIGRVLTLGNVALDDDRLRELADDSGVRPDAPLAFEDVESARRAMTEAFRNKGYLFARIEDDVVIAASEEGPRAVCNQALRQGESMCAVDVVFSVNQGPLVQTRDIVIRGNDDTKERIVRGELEVKSGTVLAAEDLERSRDNLLRIGVFDRVRVRPLDEERVEPVKDVLIELKERNRYSLEVGAGFSTEEGVRLFTGFADGNLLGSAIKLQANGRVNFWPTALLVLYNEPVRTAVEEFYAEFQQFERVEYELALGVSYPRIFGLPRGFGLGLDLVALRDLDPAFLEDTQGASLVASYTGFRPRILGDRRQASFQFRAGFDRTNVTCNDGLSTAASLRGAACSDPSDADIITGNQLIEGANAYLSAGPRFSLDLRDDPLDPRKGAFFELDSRLFAGLNPESPDLARLEGKVTFYVPLLPRLVLSTALLGGRIFPLEGTSVAVPINRRFFAGGRTTVRGYQENTLLPQDVDIVRAPFFGDPDGGSGIGVDEVGQPIGDISAGGLFFVALKAEMKLDIIGPLALAAFYDVGDLFEDGGFAFSTRVETINGVVTRPIAQGAGLGVRLATPVGPLALDIARPINPRDDGFDRWQLHFSVGTF